VATKLQVYMKDTRFESRTYYRLFWP